MHWVRPEMARGTKLALFYNLEMNSVCEVVSASGKSNGVRDNAPTERLLRPSLHISSVRVYQAGKLFCECVILLNFFRND